MATSNEWGGLLTIAENRNSRRCCAVQGPLFHKLWPELCEMKLIKLLFQRNRLLCRGKKLILCTVSCSFIVYVIFIIFLLLDAFRRPVEKVTVISEHAGFIGHKFRFLTLSV